LRYPGRWASTQPHLTRHAAQFDVRPRFPPRLEGSCPLQLLKSSRDRQTAIADYKTKYARLFRTNVPQFWQKVAVDLRRMVQQHGRLARV